MIKIPKLKIIFIFLYFLFSFSIASAASFSVSPRDLIAGKETEVVLFLNTEGHEINAVELRLKFSGEDFVIKDISDGNSIINLWVEKPSFSNPPSGAPDKGEIVFSGIIPGGFEEKEGRLAKITLIPKKTGETNFEIMEAKVLLNDGKGTEADVTTKNLEFRILNLEESQIPDSTFQIPTDTEPPENFAPQISSDPDIFGGKYFLVFFTQDKGSGIDGYAVRESQRMKKRIATNEWKEAESPYLLKDQKLRSYIYIKALDKAGNERIAVIPPKNPLRWYENYLIYGIIVLIALIIIAGYIIWRILWRK